LLDQVVLDATSVGLYVILDLHDDVQSGSPYGSGASVPKPETIDYWKAIATRYLNNTQVMFDVFNEPDYPDANTWLNGGGTITGSTGLSTTIVGMRRL
jgi:aryl-phospho-beta-D-glucosidase BglC (GH1 family)